MRRAMIDNPGSQQGRKPNESRSKLRLRLRFEVQDRDLKIGLQA